MRKTILFPLALVIVLTLVVGCSKPKQQGPKPLLLVACDYSGSLNEEGRKEYARILSGVVRLEKGDIHIVVFRYAQDPYKIYEGEPRSIKRIFPTVKNEVIAGGASTDMGTYLAPTLEQFYELAQESKAPVRILILTDGGCDDPVDTKKAAKKLSELPNLEVVLAAPVLNSVKNKKTGAIQDIRSRLERILSPLGGKLIISSKTDLEYGVNQFIDGRSR
jgi:hypothetical protein